MTKDKGLLLQSEQRFLFFLQDRITNNKNISDNNEFKKYLQGQSCDDLDLLYTSIKNHMLASFDPNNYDVICYEVFMYTVQHELNRDQAFRNYVSSTPEKREINFNLLTPEILGLYFAIADNESSNSMAHSDSELYIKEIDGEYSKPCLSGISFLVEQNYSFHLGYSLEEMKEVFKLPSRETLEIDASYFKDISELEAGVRNNYIQENNLNTGDDSNPRLLKNIIYFPVVRPLYNQYFDLFFIVLNC